MAEVARCRLWGRHRPGAARRRRRRLASPLQRPVRRRPVRRRPAAPGPRRPAVRAHRPGAGHRRRGPARHGPALLVTNRGLGVLEPTALSVAVRKECGRRLRIVGTHRAAGPRRRAAQARQRRRVPGRPRRAAARRPPRDPPARCHVAAHRWRRATDRAARRRARLPGDPGPGPARWPVRPAAHAVARALRRRRSSSARSATAIRCRRPSSPRPYARPCSSSSDGTLTRSARTSSGLRPAHWVASVFAIASILLASVAGGPVSEVVVDDGMTIHYDVFGRRDGPPLVMIQGLGTDSRGGPCSAWPWAATFGASPSTIGVSAVPAPRPSRTRSTGWHST